MNSQCSDTRKHRLQAFLSALVVNGCILLVALCFSHMQFGTNDDRDISNLLADVYGTDRGHYITFVNVVLAKALSVIYRVTNNFTNWYVLFSVIGSFIALTAASYLVILRSPKRWIGVSLACIMVGILYDSHYIVFQFTHNATLLTMVGCLLLADVFIHDWDNHAFILCIVGILLLTFGSMIRFQAIFFSVPYLVMYVGYETVFLKKEMAFRHWLFLRRNALIAMCICFVLVFAARGAHNYTYKNNPELKAFNEENLLRAELLDYGFPDYESNAQALEALGVSEADIYMFTQQSFLDRDVFSYDVLEALVEMKSSQSTSYSVENLDLSSVSGVFSSLKSYWDSYYYYQTIVALLLFILLSSSHKRFLVVLGSVVASLAMMWYFVSVGRMPFRVWYSTYAPALLSLTYLSALDIRAESRKKVPRYLAPSKLGIAFRKAISLCASGVIVCTSCMVLYSVSAQAYRDDSVNITDTYEKILDLADVYTETMILLDRPTISSLTYESTITPMTCLERGSHRNICYQGGWVCWTPANLSALNNMGVENIYQSIAEGKQAVLVDARTPDLKLDFIRRHYNPDVCMMQIDSINNIGVYLLFLPE